MARLLDNKPGDTLTVKATAAIAAAHVFVKFDTDRDYAVLCGAGEDADGVLPSKAAINETLEMVTSGTVPILLGDTVANGAYVKSDSAGRAVTHTAGTFMLGQVIRGGAVGELGSLRIGKKKSDVSGSTVVTSGSAVLVGGTVTVSSTAVLGTDKIILTRLVTGGTVGHLTVGTITPGTSFVITSDSATETSTIAWAIVR
jgi:hypothetical protein